MKSVSAIIYIFIMVLSGFILASMDVGVFDWKYWVIMSCIIGAHLCGYILGYKK